MTRIGSEQAPQGQVCITCSDEGRVAAVRSVAGSVATVGVDDRQERVDVSLVEPLVAGDLVLVHAGVAIAKLGRQSPGR